MSLKMTEATRVVCLTGGEPDGRSRVKAEIYAEMPAEFEGEPVYLLAEWSSRARYTVTFHATRESLFDVFVALNRYADNAVRFAELMEERKRIADGYVDGSGFNEHYEKLVDMIENIIEWNELY